MTRTRLVVILVLLSVSAAAVSGYIYVRQQRRKEMIPKFEQQLTHTDPSVRLAGASGLLEFEPARPDALLVFAEASLELAEYDEAREKLISLRDLAEAGESIDLAKVTRLHADTCLLQAGTIVAQSDPTDADSIEDRVERLVGEAEEQRARLATLPDQTTSSLLIDVGVADVRSALLRLEARELEGNIINKRLAEQEDEAKLISITLADVRGKIAEQDGLLVEAADQVLSADPSNQVARRRLVDMHLRSGRLDEARKQAEAMASQEKLDPVTAGRIANLLLDLDFSFGEAVTVEDLRIARKLIEHPTVRDAKHPSLELARLFLLHHEAEPSEVIDVAYKLFSRPAFARHPRVVQIYTMALIAAGDARAAIDTIRPYNEQAMPSYEALSQYVLGAAYIAADNRALGDQALRESVRLKPDSLPPRVMLAESLVDQGRLGAAEPDIRAAAQINPDHPKVIALYARLAVESDDRRPLYERVESALNDPSFELTPHHAVLAVSMAMDEVERGKRSVSLLLKDSPNDALGLIGRAWGQATPQQRAAVARIVTRSVWLALQRDPMSEPRWPTYTRLSAQAMQPPQPSDSGPTPEDAIATIEQLRRNYFVPRIEQVALDLATLALERWPAQAALVADAAVLQLWLGDDDAARRNLKTLTAEQREAEGVAPVHAWLAGEDVDVTGEGAEGKPVGLPPRLQWLALATALRGDSYLATHGAVHAILTDHPWADLAVIEAMRKAIERGDHDRALAWTTVAHGVNPRLGALLRVRYLLSVGRLEDAADEGEQLITDLDPNAVVRWQAAEVRARTHLAMGRPGAAIADFTNAALVAPYHNMGLMRAAVDVAVAGDRLQSARDTLARLLGDERTPPYWRDLLLARYAEIRPNDEFGNQVERLLVFRSGDPLLRWYRARAHEAVGGDEALDRAEQTYQGLLDDAPKSPRVLLAAADLAIRRQKLDVARGLLNRLAALGGLSEQAAAERLKRIAPETKGVGVGQ